MGQAEKLTPYIYAHKRNNQNTRDNRHYGKQHLQSRTITCGFYSTEYYITALVHSAMLFCSISRHFQSNLYINPLKPELNPICYLLALLGAHHFLHVSRIRVKLLTFR